MRPQPGKIVPPHGSKQQPEAGHGEPGHGDADHDDQRMVEAGPLRIIHIVEHPEEVPPTPAVVAAFEDLARIGRHIIAAVLFVGEVDLSDGKAMLADRQG